MALSDHGHIHRRGQGGHGGLEPEVINAPFALAGPGVRNANQIKAQIVDIAPTLSTLLGLPIAANSQGRVLWEALDVPAEHDADLRQHEKEQRTALARAHAGPQGSPQGAEVRTLAMVSLDPLLYLGGNSLHRSSPAPEHKASLGRPSLLCGYVLRAVLRLRSRILDQLDRAPRISVYLLGQGCGRQRQRRTESPLWSCLGLAGAAPKLPSAWQCGLARWQLCWSHRSTSSSDCGWTAGC